MIKKPLLLRIFDAAYMQRWNDKVRPVELLELDKQAHKMIIAYFFGKFEEDSPGFNWIEIIEGGIFEFLQRLVITDLKPPIFERIKADPVKYKKLNDWVYKSLSPILSMPGNDFCQRYRNYFSSTEENLNRRILNAAHFYATKWEFDIIERANPDGYEIAEIKKQLVEKQEEYYDLTGMDRIIKHRKYRDFIDLCGQLRFQIRWATLHRIPKTSVMGHSLFVAILSYLFSLEINACEKRRINNFFTGLFHDMPEVLTRDIISPLKRSVEGLDEMIKEYEKEMMEKEVYGLIPEDWHDEIRMFTEREFDNVVTVDNACLNVSCREISEKYNSDEFNPRDGELVRAADALAAFIEAYSAIKNGSANEELHNAAMSIKKKYEKVNIAGIDFGGIYGEFGVKGVK
jgi:putative hydrolase of HD superfamily